MSLRERVERAGNAAREVVDWRRRPDLDALRDQMQAVLPADEVAAIFAVNPQRARNEVRSACRQVFDDPAWTSTDAHEKGELVKRLLDEIFGFGPLEGMLQDSEVTEVMVNGPSAIYVERNGVLERSDQSFSDASQLRALIDRILGPLGRRIDEASPMVDARLPQGHRVHAIIPPLSLEAAAPDDSKVHRACDDARGNAGGWISAGVCAEVSYLGSGSAQEHCGFRRNRQRENHLA